MACCCIFKGIMDSFYTIEFALKLLYKLFNKYNFFDTQTKTPKRKNQIPKFKTFK